MALLLAPLASGQWFDSFSAEDIGDPPENPEFTHIAYNAANAVSVVNDTAGPRAWYVTADAVGGGGGHLAFTAPAQTATVDFRLNRYLGVGAPSVGCSVRGFDEDFTPTTSTISGTTNNLFFIDTVDNAGDIVWRVGTGSSTAVTTLGADSSDPEVDVNITIDWGATNVDFVVDGNPYGPFTFSSHAALTLNGMTQACSGNSHGSYVDDLRIDGAAILEEDPLAPSGLSAAVTDGKTSNLDDGTVDLRWPVSSNDPDQDQGDFRYDIYTNGFFIGSDATTGADGEGIRYNQVQFTGGGIPSDTVFFIVAVNVTTGLQSAPSCSVTVNPSLFGDQDSCGAVSGAGIGIDFTTPTDTAAGLQGFCADLMGDSPASLFLCGLILAVITFLGLGGAFAAMAGAPGLPSVIAGALGAFGVMLFNVQAQIWSLGAAAILILLATGVALGLTRRLFLGRSSGGD